MSDRYVSDPREVVKPGDIVRVKVREVDIPRKRISLTLRLDDDPAAPRQRGGGNGGGKPDREGTPGRGSGREGKGGGKGGGKPERAGGRKQGGSDRRDRRPASAANGAMADALRRAGLA